MTKQALAHIKFTDSIFTILPSILGFFGAFKKIQKMNKMTKQALAHIKFTDVVFLQFCRVYWDFLVLFKISLSLQIFKKIQK
jgi:Ni/Fe-hydrogenase subunit HybB-like protein